jgi:hypothetical protein
MIGQRQPVVVGLSGGLGNQMFQYAAGRSLAVRFGVPLVLDLAWFGGQPERQFALSPFRIEAVQHSQYPWLSPRGRALASRLSRRWLPRIMEVPVWREPHFHYSTEFEALSEPVFLEGYWQSERFFQEIRPLLLREFALRESLPTACAKLLDEINKCDAICVHVRRGDYLSNPVAAKLHGTCTVGYYRSGIGEICQGLTSPHCFVFSDDPSWVRTFLTLDCPMTVVEVNGSNDAHFDLALMAACQHFLIANSSLSWWGAWLGTHAEKRVIAPKRWFLTVDKDTRDLLPESWIRR